MSVAKHIEITASSESSFDDAIRQGVAHASKSLQNVTGVWVKDQKATVENGALAEFRVTLKVTFVLNA